MSEQFNGYNNSFASGDAKFPKTDNNSVHVDLGADSKLGELWVDRQTNSQFTSQYQQSDNMYSEHNQYHNQSQGYQNSYGTYTQNYSAPSNYGPYQGYNQAQSGYSSSNMQPVPPGDEYPHRAWQPVNDYPDMRQPPPSLSRQGSNQGQNQQQGKLDSKQDIKKDAVAQELKQQKAQMAKQREDYVRKILVLRRELELLRAQKQELLAEHSPDHDNNYILKENNKLQNEIQSKMKTINSVIEMLTNIIGDEKNLPDLEAQIEESPKHHTRRSVSMSKDQPDSENRYNYVHYDPELHWCRICDVFPKSAKDLLMHLHSKEHKDITQERDMVDTPWHKLPAESEMPYYVGAPKKRLPIKGLQFFISATAWYCKLCDIWMGDLHCASQHLKSQNHNQNYTSFVEQNPHWEIEWLKDRERALSRITNIKTKTSDSEDEILGKHKKKRHDKGSPMLGNKESKRKKRKSRKKKKYTHFSDSSSSSSSSDSSSEEGSSSNDKSKSIRVAMRNKMKLQAQMIMNEDLGGKWEVLGRLVEEHKRKEQASSKEMGKESDTEDTLINQWMTIKETEDKDKKLLDNLKDRMRQKQEAEKARLAQMEQKKREKEKEEQELREKREREEREQREREEAKKKEMEDLRLRERDRIKFKTRDKYRRRYSPSQESPDSSPGKDSREKSRRSRSPSSERRRHRDKSSDRYHHKDYKHENGRKSPNRHSKSPNDHHRSKRNSNRSPSHESDSVKRVKKPPPPPSYKKLPFIGRMPLFKNKKLEEKPEKEIKKEDYELPRQTRFQPGNLARAFIPDPDVVCFPKLSTIPPILEPPPPPPSLTLPRVPSPPKISENKNTKKEQKKNVDNGEVQQIQQKQQQQQQHIIQNEENKMLNNVMPPKQGEHLPQDFQDALNYIYPDHHPEMPPYHFSNMDYEMMYGPPMYDYSQDIPPMEIGGGPPQGIAPPLEHMMPLPPPPLPPDDPNDDLAMLGISADDMAAQMF